MAIRIVSDSTCDLPPDLAKELNVQIVPLKVLFGEMEYRDGIDLSNAEFYTKMAAQKELPTTAQVNPGEFIQEFSKWVDQGDEIIGIFISSKLSGTYASAVLAREELGRGKIHLVDSETVTFNLGLLVLEAARMVKIGHSAEEILTRIEEVKKNGLFLAVIDKLENLVKGGRLSPVGAIAGGLLGIKPIITVKDGQVVLTHKIRGQKKAFAWILEEAVKKMDINGRTIAIGHTQSPEGLSELKQMVLAKYQPKEIVEFEIGSVVGTHAGAGCVGIGVIN